MYYFLKKENFHIDQYDFSINISPRLTKKEQEILNLFLTYFDIDREYSEFEFNPNLTKASLEEFKDSINNINKKTLSIFVYDGDKELTSLFFNIFDIVVFEGTKVIFKLSQELRLSQQFGNFFSRFSIHTLLKFKSTYTYSFYKLFLKSINQKKIIEFELSIAELRSLLNIPDGKYTRFYDFESKVLKPIIKDLELSDTYVNIEKMKSSKGKGGRITKVKFSIYNSYFIEINRDTNVLLKEFVDYIEDFSNAYDSIYTYRKIHSLDETRLYIKNNLDTVFSK